MGKRRRKGWMCTMNFCLRQLGTLEFWETLLDSFGNLGPIAPIMLAMVESFFPPLPLIAIVALNVAAHGGILGFLYSWAGVALGGCITVRRVTQRLLQREGYRVSLAADGLQALERLQEERPTVVLSDIEMPRMDGFDLARNIRADSALRDLPIIMITSRIAEKHREHAMELGVNHYLGKPYSDEELLSLIQHYARLAAATAEV